MKKGETEPQSIRDLISDGAMDKLGARAEADPVFMRILNDVVGNAGSAPWRQLWDGVSIRPIWDERTYLMRCAAGKQVPCHVHDREEFLVVLDGELRIGEAHLFTGDIEISPPGSEHPAAEALEDCLALVQYSR
jgi:anti-sigma factor ChrR (cupin superfamily)